MNDAKLASTLPSPSHSNQETPPPSSRPHPPSHHLRLWSSRGLPIAPCLWTNYVSNLFNDISKYHAVIYVSKFRRMDLSGACRTVEFVLLAKFGIKHQRQAVDRMRRFKNRKRRFMNGLFYLVPFLIYSVMACIFQLWKVVNYWEKWEKACLKKETLWNQSKNPRNSWRL